MPIEISVQCADVANVPADLLLLKHAQHFYGADQTVAARLTERGICNEGDIAPAKGSHVLLETSGAIAAKRTLFLGTPRLRDFRYQEMTQFARRAINIIGENRLPVRTLTTTVHGANYGLDVAESLRALILGFQQGLATSPLPQLAKIIFVERNERRCELLQTLLQGVELVSAPHAATPGQPTAVPATATLNVGTTPAAEPLKKKSVFVAMPFAEEFEDVYQFGIYSAIRRCGYICEKVDESVFAGSIVDRIMDGIRNAQFVIADLTLEKPNVYLEVGYAWGTNKPVILLAREGQRLHFDLSHHKCLFYKTIGKLAEALEKTVLDMFGPGSDRG
ncbi:hypothetical protein AYO44_07455 [Planctomycetaceae bacterium SCGC AG-212-F19]|nr:hypothetical protein AYO44_07455 [Planctomycetaceae bacterium SCGC AG-212-F19]